jgi:hypothetical protein
LVPESDTSGHYVSGAVEGILDEAVLRRLVESVGAEMGYVNPVGGKQQLDRRLSGYNEAVKYSPWCVLRDFDTDAACPAELIVRLLPEPAPTMCFRIVVRAVEAWLMADRQQMATFLSVSRSRIPVSPEDARDPKETLVNVARRSNKTAVRDSMVPRPGSGRSVGTGYTSLMIEYIRSRWRPEVAAESSESLRRCIACLKSLAGRIV